RRRKEKRNRPWRCQVRPWLPASPTAGRETTASAPPPAAPGLCRPDTELVLGGRGNDRLLEQAGNNILFGAPAGMSCAAGRATTRLFGGPGNGRITPALGRDRVSAGSGNDRMFS